MNSENTYLLTEKTKSLAFKAKKIKSENTKLVTVSNSTKNMVFLK